MEALQSMIFKKFPGGSNTTLQKVSVILIREEKVFAGLRRNTLSKGECR